MPVVILKIQEGKTIEQKRASSVYFDGLMRGLNMSSICMIASRI